MALLLKLRVPSPTLKKRLLFFSDATTMGHAKARDDEEAGGREDSGKETGGSIAGRSIES